MSQSQYFFHISNINITLSDSTIPTTIINFHEPRVYVNYLLLRSGRVSSSKIHNYKRVYGCRFCFHMAHEILFMTVRYHMML